MVFVSRVGMPVPERQMVMPVSGGALHGRVVVVVVVAVAVYVEMVVLHIIVVVLVVVLKLVSEVPNSALADSYGDTQACDRRCCEPQRLTEVVTGAASEHEQDGAVAEASGQAQDRQKRGPMT